MVFTCDKSVFLYKKMEKDYPTVSVTKLEIFHHLCEAGLFPSVSNRDYERQVRECLHDALGLDEKVCSVSTNLAIADQAEKFFKSTKYYYNNNSCNRHPDRVAKKPYMTEGVITIEVVPVFHDIAQLAPSTSGHGLKVRGPYKSFEAKESSAQTKDIAKVSKHEPGAIVRATPAAAAKLGLPKFATALRKMAKDPEVNAEKAMDGMENKSEYTFIIYTFKK